MLWELMADLAHERRVQVDEIVSEAMIAYAEIRGHALPPEGYQHTLASPAWDESTGHNQRHAPPVRAPYEPPARGGRARPRSGPPGGLPPPPARPPSRAPEHRPRAMAAAPPPGRSYTPPPARRAPPPEPAAYPPQRGYGAPPPTYDPPPPAYEAPPQRGYGSAGGYAPPPPPASMRNERGRMPPPPLPGREQDEIPTSARFLSLIYQGDRVPVNRDRFVIGRSKAQADYRLDDPNVSRQHVMIERLADQFYVVDLGSTNGVAVNGVKVSRRALNDGDVIRIGGHELVCELR